MLGDTKKDKITQILFLAPAIFLFTVFFVVPSSTSFFYAFTDWNGVGNKFNFVGFENFKYMFTNKDIFSPIFNTIYYAVLTTVFMNFGSFFLALALNRKSAITNSMRVIFFIPNLVAGIIVGFVFKQIYAPIIDAGSMNMGALNALFHALHLDFLTGNYLGQTSTAMLFIVLTGLWQSLGFSSIIYLSNLQTIPADLYESAEIDGAGFFSRIKNITWPMVAPAFSINLTLTLINSLKTYEVILLLTGGGPGTSTKVVNMAIVEYSFSSFKVGLGCAMSVLLAIFVFVLAGSSNVFLRKREMMQ